MKIQFRHLLALWTFALGVAVSYQPPVMEPVWLPAPDTIITTQWPDPRYGVVVFTWPADAVEATPLYTSNTFYTSGTFDMATSETQTVGAATAACIIQDAEGGWKLCQTK